MKRWASALVSLWLGTVDLAVAQETSQIETTVRPSPDPTVVKDLEKFVTDFNQRILAACKLVDASIDAAVRAGTLKEPSVATWKSLLNQIRNHQGKLPPPTTIFPRVPKDAGLEEADAAWNNLRNEIDQLVNSAREKRSKLRDLLSKALDEIALNAKRPEDLQSARELLAVSRRIPEDYRPPFESPYFRDYNTSVETVLNSLESVLLALQQKDYAEVAVHFNRLEAKSSGSLSNEFKFGPAVIEFRARLSEPLRVQASKDQRAVEKALQADLPPVECENLILTFDRSSANALSVFGEYNRPANEKYLRNDERLRLVKCYREVLTFLIAEKKGLEATFDDVSEIGSYAAGPQSLGGDFQLFMAELRARKSDVMQAARERKEKQREADRIAVQRRQEMERAKQMADLLEKVRTPLREVQTAKDLIKVIDSIPEMWVGREPFDSRVDEMRGLIQSLRQVAVWWLEPGNQMGMNIYAESYAPRFGEELRALRERAIRDVLSVRLSAPELKQPPLSEMSSKQAVQQIAEAAGKKGDWLRAYRVLAAFAPLDGGNDFSQRAATIKTYLAGLNLESAAQYREAAASYLKVLESVGENLPIKEAGERLQALQKAHPQSLGDIKR